MTIISKKALLGKNVQIGHNVRIYDNVSVGDDTVIDDFCILGYPAPNEYRGQPLTINANSIIRSHTILYEGSTYGERLRVGHHSLLREGIIAGKDLQVGSYNDLEGVCTIGDHCRFQGYVIIGKGSKIGNLVWLFPYVVLTNDPLPPSGLMEGVTVHDGAVVCTSSVLLPGSTIGEGAFVAAMTRVKGEIAPRSVVVGNKTDIIGDISILTHQKSEKQHPWMQHFAKAYPEDAQPLIAELYENLEKLRVHD